MSKNINVRTLLMNIDTGHNDIYRAIDNILYIIRSDKVVSPVTHSHFRLDMGALLICEKGTVDLNLDMRNYRVKGNHLLLIMPGQIIKYNRFSEDFKGTIMLFSTEFMASINFPINIPLVLFDVNNPIIHLPREQMNILKSFVKTIIEITESSISNKREVFKHLCIALLLSYKTEITGYRTTGENTDKILSKNFLRILGKNYRNHRDLGFYANEQHLSKNYFSAAIKKETGLTATEWIDDFIVLEAKQLLSTTNKTIQEISIELNFCNQSFFGKFFKRVTGISPKEYRDRIFSD